MKKQFVLYALAIAGMLAGPASALAASISTQMDIGARGADVTTLQQTLAADASLYPQGLVTGYFGSLSAAAVSRFQARYGLPQVGRVGPLTIAKFNEIYGGATASGGAPIISSVVTSQTNSGQSLMWNTNKPATGVVYYSTSPFLLSEAAGMGGAPGISGTNVFTMNTPSNTSNSVVLSNVAASTTYNYIIVSTDASGNIQMTWPALFTSR